MPTPIPKLALAAALVATAHAAGAASDYLLQLDGIKGESKATASIETFQWSGATAQGAFDPFTPTFAGGVRVAAGDLGSDGRWESVSLTARTPEGDTFFRYELKNVLITSYDLSGAGANAARDHKDWILLESTSGPVMRWSPPTANGSRGDWIAGSWDADTGRFVGDPAVLGAFDDLGAERLADGTLAITAAVPEAQSWALMRAGAAAIGAQLRRRRRAAA